jgi:hypothetical protein
MVEESSPGFSAPNEHRLGENQSSVITYYIKRKKVLPFYKTDLVVGKLGQFSITLV